MLAGDREMIFAGNNLTLRIGRAPSFMLSFMDYLSISNSFTWLKKQLQYFHDC